MGKRSIPVGEIREKLPDSLDNELYKALKALRESQSWRMETLDTVAVENGFVSSSRLENDHGPTAEQAG